MKLLFWVLRTHFQCRPGYDWSKIFEFTTFDFGTYASTPLWWYNLVNIELFKRLRVWNILTEIQSHLGLYALSLLLWWQELLTLVCESECAVRYTSGLTLSDFIPSGTNILSSVYPACRLSSTEKAPWVWSQPAAAALQVHIYLKNHKNHKSPALWEPANISNKENCFDHIK